MNTAGLSLSDAPPFRTVYPFFAIAALFGILSFMALSFAGEANRYDPLVIASIHLFTIGFFLNAVFGSLVQMLPVVGGIKIESPKIIKITAIGIGSGAILFFVGFTGYRPLLSVAVVVLSISIALAFGMLIIQILKNKGSVSVTVRGIKLALISALLGLGLGLHLLSSHAFSHIGASHIHFTQIHILLSVFGFLGVLIISVSHQVLPMFYVSPEFPKFCRRWPIVVFVAAILLFIPSELINFVTKVIIWTAFLAFSIVALKKLKERRRQLSDASLKFWQTGLASLALGLLLWAYDLFFELPHSEFLFALFFGLGFAGSIVKAMINKIVPFLAWFHLTSQGRWDAPNMREMITDKSANIELYLHLMSIILFLVSLTFTHLFAIASLTASASFAVLFRNVLRAIRMYNTELTKLS
jgi:hypothetical protein